LPMTFGWPSSECQRRGCAGHSGGACRTTGGVVPAGLVLTFSDAVLSSWTASAQDLNVAGHPLIAVNGCEFVVPPITGGDVCAVGFIDSSRFSTAPSQQRAKNICGTVEFDDDPPSSHHLGHRHMPFEAKRFRDGAIPIHQVPVGDVVAAGTEEQRPQPQQPDVAYSQPVIGGRGG
jgi:hypothetical protein